MINRIFMLFLSTLLLAACGSSEPKKTPITEPVNNPPTIEVSFPESLVSLDTLTATITAKDPDNDAVTTEITLFENDTALAKGTQQIEYEIPLAQTNKTLTLVASATDDQGAITTETHLIDVPAIDISFEFPFGSYSQRYIDIEATISNLNSANTSVQWQLSNSEYEFETINQTKLRFYAHKKYTENANSGNTNLPQGDGYSEMLTATLRIEGSEFPHEFTILPVEQIPEWPHQTSALNSPASASVVSNQGLLNQVDTSPYTCLNNEAQKPTTLFAFDFNKDGTDDYYCVFDLARWSEEYSDIYFYLSTSDGSYTEQLVQTNIINAQRSALISWDDNLPTFFSIDSQSNILAFDYNEITEKIAKTSTTPTNVSDIGDSIITQTDSGFTLAIANKTFNVITYDNFIDVQSYLFSDSKLKLQNEFKASGLQASIYFESLTYSDINEDGIKELLLYFTEKNETCHCPEYVHLFVADKEFTKINDFGQFERIQMLDLDNDGSLELTGTDFKEVNSGQLKATSLNHLTLDSDGNKVITQVQDYFNNDLFFYYYSVFIDENIGFKIYIDSYAVCNDYTYIALGDHLLTTQNNTPPCESYPLETLEDIDGDGDLDIKLSNDQGWFENANGYPIQAIIENYEQGQE